MSKPTSLTDFVAENDDASEIENDGEVMVDALDAAESKASSYVPPVAAQAALPGSPSDGNSNPAPDD